MTEPRSDEAIRADLARKAELRAAFRRRLEEVKAGKRGGLIDYATAREEDDLNRRLAADAGSLLARAERAEAENARLRAALDRVLQSPAIEYRSDPHLIVNPEGDQRELARAQETIKNANAARELSEPTRRQAIERPHGQDCYPWDWQYGDNEPDCGHRAAAPSEPQETTP